MDMRLTLKPDAIKDALPADKELLGVAAEAMEACVTQNLMEKNNSTRPNPFGLPKTSYYGEASETVRGGVEGDSAVVTVGPDGADPKSPGMGIALHFYGGTVFPKKKALAVPISPAVAGMWPSEGSRFGDIVMMWAKGEDHGFLKDKKTNELLWMLLPKATIPADPTVLPSDEKLAEEVESAILPLLEAS